MSYETGTNEAYADVKGYGAGENEGTEAVRIELLWRDFMRLSCRRFKNGLFRLEGSRVYKEGEVAAKWKTADKDTAEPAQDPSPDDVARILDRFMEGTTGPWPDRRVATRAAAHGLHVEPGPAERGQLPRQAPLHRLEVRRRVG